MNVSFGMSAMKLTGPVHDGLCIRQEFTAITEKLISVDLFIFQIELPLTAVILISIFIGVIMGYLYNLMSLLKQKKKYRRLKNKKDVLHDLSDVLEKPVK